eukprot:TRINITY_DN16342_c0_g1_i1.p2 TRINITY_DN16342_c0_g1~~TRINITY_DN16342_c0_g1_i1.p2  ORF type:complete len:133 (-),score=33.48 TRINITY_DN16342_c0_g1_i1:61-459(-)
MLRSLVGSEMCIRDRTGPCHGQSQLLDHQWAWWCRHCWWGCWWTTLAQRPKDLRDICTMVAQSHPGSRRRIGLLPRLLLRGGVSLTLARLLVHALTHLGLEACLLYTSDAADEEDSVDLGGRRIIKKKKTSA